MFNPQIENICVPAGGITNKVILQWRKFWHNQGYINTLGRAKILICALYFAKTKKNIYGIIRWAIDGKYRVIEVLQLRFSKFFIRPPQ